MNNKVSATSLVSLTVRYEKLVQMIDEEGCFPHC